MESESDHFSPYRADGKLYGFICVVPGADQPVSGAIAVELAGTHAQALKYICGLILIPLHGSRRSLHLHLHFQLFFRHRGQYRKNIPQHQSDRLPVLRLLGTRHPHTH